MAVSSKPLPQRPLLAAYGGGHAQVIGALGHALIKEGISPRIIGFTTAYQALKRQGLPVVSVQELEDPDPAGDAPFRAAVQPFIQGNTHPDITAEETETYFALGLRGLADEVGMTAAMERVQSEGRKAFCPVSVMKRYLERHEFDCVVATTSPRFELALLRAARQMHIPSLAVSDLFLLNEREWILAGGYAAHLTVLSRRIADELLQLGLSETKLHVTGNPIFDELLPRPGDDARRHQLRSELGVQDKQVIVWPSPAVTQPTLYDRPLLTPEQLVHAFEPFCQRNANFTYLLRPHPNAPYTLPKGALHGKLDPGVSARDALLIADIVCVELSTMGLQAALKGIPVICVGFGKEAVYPSYGLAHSAETLDEALDMIETNRGIVSPASNVALPPIGSATAAVLGVMADMI